VNRSRVGCARIGRCLAGCPWRDPRGTSASTKRSPGAHPACSAGSRDVPTRGRSTSRTAIRAIRRTSRLTLFPCSDAVGDSSSVLYSAVLTAVNSAVRKVSAQRHPQLAFLASQVLAPRFAFRIMRDLPMRRKRRHSLLGKASCHSAEGTESIVKTNPCDPLDPWLITLETNHGSRG
jgi:hypothetical protein